MSQPKVKAKNLDTWIKAAAAAFCILYAIFAWINQPKSNADKIIQMEYTINSLNSTTKQQDKDIARLGGKIEAIDSSISEIKSDIRDIRNVVIGKKYD